MYALSPDTILIRNERLAWRCLEGGAVILFPEAGTLHRLNPTGTRFWEHIDGRRSLKEIAAALTDEYDAEIDDILDGVLGLADDLVDSSLAKVAA
jgi:hypothetical protein